MKEIFADTNVIIDFLTSRAPFSDDAAQILTLAERKLLQVNICALSYSNIYYVLRKFSSHRQILESLENLSLIVNILPVDHITIQRAIKSKFKDFEDAIQYECALQYNNCDVIVTRNHADFKKSEIAVMSPDMYLKSYLV